MAYNSNLKFAFPSKAFKYYNFGVYIKINSNTHTHTHIRVPGMKYFKGIYTEYHIPLFSFIEFVIFKINSIFIVICSGFLKNGNKYNL